MGFLTVNAPLQAAGASGTAADAADAGGAHSPPSGGGGSPTEPGPLPPPQQLSTVSTSGRPASPLGGGGGNSESRSMADSRVKKFHKLLGEHVVRAWVLCSASYQSVRCSGLSPLKRCRPPEHCWGSSSRCVGFRRYCCRCLGLPDPCQPHSSFSLVADRLWTACKPEHECRSCIP